MDRIQALILSGGKGTRLKPLTDNTPKPMLPVGDKPHLEHIINLLKRNGIKDIIFSTGYLHSQIYDYFKDGQGFGVNILYKEDGDMQLGTAGAIKNCESLLNQSSCDNFLVFNGDILTDIECVDLIVWHYLYFKSRDIISVALTPVDNPSNFGVAEIEDNTNRITNFIEKPSTLEYGNLINSGIYMMPKSVLDVIPKGKYSMLETDIFPDYAEKGKLYGYIDNKMYWLDIGTIERYRKANHDYELGLLH